MSRLFGGVKQVGYVVRDIQKAMAYWADLGVGPWFYKEDAGCTEYRYYGKQVGLPKLSISLAFSGDMQMELIQQNDAVPTPYLDSLKKNGEIAQHTAFWTLNDFDAYCDSFLRKGYIEAHAGRMGQAPRGRFAYFVHPELPSGMFEISEQTGGKGKYFEKVRQASLNWNGNDPIRLPSSLK